MMAAQSRTTAIAASPAWMIMPHLGEAADSSGLHRLSGDSIRV
jgi:hypothetical protein